MAESKYRIEGQTMDKLEIMEAVQRASEITRLVGLRDERKGRRCHT